MKLISLTQGHFAKVDDSDFENLNQYKWHIWKVPRTRIIYAKRKVWIDKKAVDIRMHRMIMNVSNDMQVDHKNGDGLDNQRLNLRTCTQLENKGNRSLQKNSTTGFIGVSKSGKKFLARIWSNGETITIGIFPSALEAAWAYDIAALKLRGPFAKLNFYTALTPVEKKD